MICVRCMTRYALFNSDLCQRCKDQEREDDDIVDALAGMTIGYAIGSIFSDSTSGPDYSYTDASSWTGGGGDSGGGGASGDW